MARNKVSLNRFECDNIWAYVRICSFNEFNLRPTLSWEGSQIMCAFAFKLVHEAFYLKAFISIKVSKHLMFNRVSRIWRKNYSLHSEFRHHENTYYKSSILLIQAVNVYFKKLQVKYFYKMTFLSSDRLSSFFSQHILLHFSVLFYCTFMHSFTSEWYEWDSTWDENLLENLHTNFEWI